MAFESLTPYLEEIDRRLANRESPLKISRDLGLSKTILYDYKKLRFDIQNPALDQWTEEQKKSHAQRLEEGKEKIINSLELLNKAKVKADFLLSLELDQPYKTAEGEEKKLSLASAAIYWQMGVKMACEAIKQEQEMAGDDPESRKASALESLSEAELDARLAALEAIEREIPP